MAVAPDSIFSLYLAASITSTLARLCQVTLGALPDGFTFLFLGGLRLLLVWQTPSRLFTVTSVSPRRHHRGLIDGAPPPPLLLLLRRSSFLQVLLHFCFCTSSKLMRLLCSREKALEIITSPFLHFLGLHVFFLSSDTILTMKPCQMRLSSCLRDN